jgi:hypothetical protein
MRAAHAMALQRKKEKVLEKTGGVEWKHETRTVDPDMGPETPVSRLLTRNTRTHLRVPLGD